MGDRHQHLEYPGIAARRLSRHRIPEENAASFAVPEEEIDTRDATPSRCSWIERTARDQMIAAGQIMTIPTGRTWARCSPNDAMTRDSTARVSWATTNTNSHA